MKKIKIILNIFIFTVLSGIIIFLATAGIINISRSNLENTDDFYYLTGDAKKVILFIGDGMGENHIKNGEMYFERDLFSSFAKEGYVSTHSKNTFYPTDSAAAATALATGKKTYNTRVAMYNGKNLKSISEYAKENNLGVGIVTTDTLSGATPSGFSAHAKKRSYEDDIINSQLQGNIDLYLGAGYESYINYKENFEEKGYSFISSYSKLTTTDSKLIASFPQINNYTTENDLPTLPLLTEYAINYMEQNYPDGYFLMIEGAHIDKMSHNNDIFSMLQYLDEFEHSVSYALETFQNNSDVCIIVTADHETGKLDLAESKDLISDNLYNRRKHSARNVKYFIYQKNNTDINKIQYLIDNTDIHKICKKLLAL